MGSGSSDSQGFSNSLFGSEESFGYGFSQDAGFDERINLMQDFIDQMRDVKPKGPLGLKLGKSESLVNLVQTRLSQPWNTDLRIDTNSSPSTSTLTSPDKMKASKFPIMALQIGNWKKVGVNEGELVAKCYYSRHVLVWEVLDRDSNLMRKMEVDWSEILAMQPILQHNQPGILHIELKSPPSFFKEKDPKPRQHTLWEEGLDFTGGQASIYRRHLVIFPPRVLEKYYEKLLQCDNRFFEMTKTQFLQSPYFHLDYERSHVIPEAMHLYPNTPSFSLSGINLANHREVEKPTTEHWQHESTTSDHVYNSFAGADISADEINTILFDESRLFYAQNANYDSAQQGYFNENPPINDPSYSSWPSFEYQGSASDTNPDYADNPWMSLDQWRM